jgi:DNA mismatch repair ATPase MutS
MSGKSTFLRTCGINLCLANAGAPVNAPYFKTSLFELFTCIKVNDSVVEGISYFYAEVKRLKELLDEFGNGNGLQKFFLIDEIFKGKNNKERLIGSRAFIKKLYDLKGTGMISTHDLELVRLSDEINAIKNYHFREEIVNGKMNFDYQIHKGPCPTTNALRIMEMSGLPVD